MATLPAEVTETCPYCGDVDPLLNVHRSWASEGRFSNGRSEFTPACTCGQIFQDSATAESFASAKSLASRVQHPFGVKIYCTDPWHLLHPVEAASV